MDKWHDSLVLLFLSQWAPTFVINIKLADIITNLHTLTFTSHSAIAHLFPNTMEQINFVFR